LFKLTKNGAKWMPSTPINPVGSIVFAYVPSLSCTLEVANGKARINGGAWHVLPAMITEGRNQIAVASYPSGLFDLTFEDTSKMFNDMTASDNEAMTTQSVSIEFHNLQQGLTANVKMMAIPDSLTASFTTLPSSAVVPFQSSAAFTITRTPKKPIYWGNMRDGGVIALEVIYA